DARGAARLAAPGRLVGAAWRGLGRAGVVAAPRAAAARDPAGDRLWLRPVHLAAAGNELAAPRQQHAPRARTRSVSWRRPGPSTKRPLLASGPFAPGTRGCQAIMRVARPSAAGSAPAAGRWSQGQRRRGILRSGPPPNCSRTAA